MADNYCPVCRKSTPHKSIMRRSPNQPSSHWQIILFLLSQGTHYYKMERQQFCRICNHQNQLVTLPISSQQVLSR